MNIGNFHFHLQFLNFSQFNGLKFSYKNMTVEYYIFFSDSQYNRFQNCQISQTNFPNFKKWVFTKIRFSACQKISFSSSQTQCFFPEFLLLIVLSKYLKNCVHWNFQSKYKIQEQYRTNKLWKSLKTFQIFLPKSNTHIMLKTFSGNNEVAFFYICQTYFKEIFWQIPSMIIV